MKAREVVHKLLEADGDLSNFDPKELLRQAANADKRKRRAKIPEFIEYAPEEFRQAIGKPNTHELWEPFYDGHGQEYWPSMDDDLDPPWTQYAFHPAYLVSDGTLYVRIMMTDNTGDQDVAYEYPYSYKDHAEHRQMFSHKKWLESIIEYEEWVVENGSDPLNFFMAYRPERAGVEWTFEIGRDGDAARLLRAWRTAEPDEIFDQPALLPPEAAAYATLQNPDDPILHSSWRELVDYYANQPNVQMDRDRLRVTDTLEAEADHADNRGAAELRQRASTSLERHRQALATADPDMSFVVP